MALRGVTPKKIEKRLKAFLYGEAGAGKTTAAIQFPKPYLIDTEKGAENDQYVELIESQGGAVFQTSDFDEMMEEIHALLTEDHEYKTLVIDPLTIVYNQLLDECAKQVGTEFGRHYGEANKKMKRLMNFLLRLDMNVIITSHAKKEYGDNLAVLGVTFDCYKKIDYLFDLVIELQKRAKERYGIIKKSRLSGFKEGDSFKFSYDEVAKRYGSETLERKAIKQELATKDQLDEFKSLVDDLGYPQSTLDKWLKKAKVDSFSEMKKEDMQKCIDLLKVKY